MGGPFVYVIQTTEFQADGRRRFCNVETSHASLEALAVDLRSGPVVVQQLFTHRSKEEGVLEIHSRRPFLLTWNFIFNAYVSDKRFVEYDSEVEG